MVRQGTLTPSLAGSSPAIPANSSRASHPLLRLFSKVKAHSFRCSSFPNRTRFAGLRFGRGYLNSIPDPVAQLAEHLPFKQGVRSSNLRWVTKKRSKRFIACSVFLQWGGLARSASPDAAICSKIVAPGGPGHSVAGPIRDAAAVAELGQRQAVGDGLQALPLGVAIQRRTEALPSRAAVPFGQSTPGTAFSTVPGVLLLGAGTPLGAISWKRCPGPCRRPRSCCGAAPRPRSPSGAWPAGRA